MALFGHAKRIGRTDCASSALSEAIPSPSSCSCSASSLSCVRGDHSRARCAQASSLCGMSADISGWLQLHLYALRAHGDALLLGLILGEGGGGLVHAGREGALAQVAASTQDGLVHPSQEGSPRNDKAGVGDLCENKTFEKI